GLVAACGGDDGEQRAAPSSAPETTSAEPVAAPALMWNGCQVPVFGAGVFVSGRATPEVRGLVAR
ncbi:MAG: hypothetical protein L0Y54_22825, partial [Sporichthyaceae bacterium]|nr:hypothetical protein [Sporichthyaceae bacterium]